MSLLTDDMIYEDPKDFTLKKDEERKRNLLEFKNSVKLHKNQLCFYTPTTSY